MFLSFIILISISVLIIKLLTIYNSHFINAIISFLLDKYILILIHLLTLYFLLLMLLIIIKINIFLISTLKRFFRKNFLLIKFIIQFVSK